MLSMESETKTWTDDLPVCNKTGAGTSTNKIYKQSGTRQEAYDFRDRSAHVKIDDNTSMYLIFSGHHGSKVAETALSRVAAETLLGQLTVSSTESEVKKILLQAFNAAENGYLDQVDHLIATKTSLQCEIPDGQYDKYQDAVEEISNINAALSVGCSAVLALIHCNKLYICNIGNCKALLCKNDLNNVLRSIQLSVDHNLTNEDEILRLSQLGLNIELLKQSPLKSTRCIGSYLEKTGFRDCEYLSGSTSETAVNAIPEVVGAIPLDESCRFLLLMSGGLCKSLHDIQMYGRDSSQEKVTIVDIIVEQFRVQETLMGVSQTAVNQVAQLHHDTYMRRIKQTDFNCQDLEMQEDITLLLRNFNFPMPNSVIRSNTDTLQSTNSSTSSIENEILDQNRKVRPYVDFSDYYQRVEEARASNTLPKGIKFD